MPNSPHTVPGLLCLFLGVIMIIITLVQCEIIYEKETGDKLPEFAWLGSLLR